jgi:8-oxo-dGTP pyrophosphatase MutT (NUDIX family)
MSPHYTRESLLELLRRYYPLTDDRLPVLERLIAFVESTPMCAERSNIYGHLTGSAWVVNSDRSKALLLHHRKLNRWMQTGGHADGEFDLLSVALREAHEESGLARIEPVSREVFDVDIHEIPPYKDLPAHYHFDVRFLLQGDEDEPIVHNEESNGVAWIPLKEITSYTEEESVMRMARTCSRDIRTR